MREHVGPAGAQELPDRLCGRPSAPNLTTRSTRGRRGEMRSIGERRPTNQFSRAGGITQCSPASAGSQRAMMADPSHTRQAHTGRPPRACPVQLLVIPRPDPLGTGRQARSATTFTRLYRRERLALNLTHQARTGWPGDAEKLSDRSRFRPASLIWPTRPTGSSRRRDALEVRNGNNQSVPSRLRYNAAFYCGRLLNRREDAWVIPISPGARMIESQAPVSSNSSLERGPGPFGAGRLARCAAASGWLSSDAEASPRESLQPRTCWPGTSGNPPDRWRRRTASSYSALPSTRG